MDNAEFRDRLDDICALLADGGGVEEAAYIRGAADGALGEKRDMSYVVGFHTQADAAYRDGYDAAQKCPHV